MPTTVPGRPTRTRILDATLHLLTTTGLTKTTTKAIAATAHCSEAALYKHFTDKTDLLACLFTERLPTPTHLLPNDTDADTDAEACCAHLIAQLLTYYRQSMPLLGALLADPTLLPAQRTPPHHLLQAVTRSLTRLREREQIPPDADIPTAATLLLGICFHHAALAALTPHQLPYPPPEFTTAVARTVAATLSTPTRTVTNQE
ncbi:MULTISPECIES: TetR/AcrR family transcriptional regulator [unclassified Streptomyces]|uniref:TetR/AcrR family transcriptional regulator n=1 Tax=unclassified Streptomyces TaxID=2593676 RepID=UPI002DDC4F35|nr:TetR/AcrR family transcriptional regulator [Streptomyces sp. NBC_00243]WRZ17024.1 TetR/AcrR family transcriptional regulator [Streptomyces sp. NBC_00243]WRZ25640.1 TetR/AcrR family transcriptional regulator [Streptomyces sp. NBC_00243]